MALPVKERVRRWTQRHGQTPAQRAFFAKCIAYNAECKAEGKPRHRDAKRPFRDRRMTGARRNAKERALYARIVVRPGAKPKPMLEH